MKSWIKTSRGYIKNTHGFYAASSKVGSVTKDLNIKKGYGIIGKKQNGEESEMAKIEVKCPYCGQEKVVKYGKSRSGKQKFNAATMNAVIKYFSWNMKKMLTIPE